MPKAEADKTDRVLVLKTVFNDVWDNFNIHELSNVMIQAISDYTTAWRVRDSSIPFSPTELDALIPSSSLTGKNVDVFVEEFSGNSFSSLPFSQAKELFTDNTSPLLTRSGLFRDEDGEMRVGEFNLLNYKYWILGDRRFLLSRKRTRNVGDLVTQWRRSAVRSSFNLTSDPAHVMITQAMEQYWDALDESDLAADPPNRDNWEARFGIAPERDALFFDPEERRQGQLTLDLMWTDPEIRARVATSARGLD